MIDRPEIIFQIRVYDPFVPSLYFAPDLGQRIGYLSTLTIPNTAGSKRLASACLHTRS